MRFLLALMLLAPSAAWAQAQASNFVPEAVPMPDWNQAIGFDDIIFSPALHKVIVPGGASGRLFLVDPHTLHVTSITGFSHRATYSGRGHSDGITSADEGEGFIFTADRTSRKLYIVQPNQKKIVGFAALSSQPDYVRYVAETKEVWVTEPSSQRIEIFSFSNNPPELESTGFIAVPGGPECLVIDHLRHKAYTNLWQAQTAVIDLKAHAVVSHWANGCQGARGLALDAQGGFLFAGCAEGSLSVLDVEHHGRLTGTARTGPGVDSIAYNPRFKHVYVPSASNATLTVIGLTMEGIPSPITFTDAVDGSHCAASDDEGHVFVCDPLHGQLLRYSDAP